MIADRYDPQSMFLVEKMGYGKYREMDTFHFHDCYELFFLLEGERTFIVGSNTLSIYKQDILCLPPNIFHRAIGKSSYSRYVIYFDDSFIAKYYTSSMLPLILDTIQAGRISLDQSDFQNALAILTDLEQLNFPADELVIFSKFTTLLTLLHTNIGHARELEPTSANQIITDILQYINKNYNTLENIEKIADTFHLSKYYLCHLFKENTGMTIVQYLTTVKMKHACELLIHTKLTITEISERCGFHTSMYFNNVFKRELKITPRVYRKRYTLGIDSN